MKKAKKLFRTTLLLTVTSFASKTAAVWFNVRLASAIGSAGIGMWNLVLSVYFFSRTLSGAGMTLVSMRLMLDEPDSQRINLKKLYAFSFFQGLLTALILFILAGRISESFISSPAAAPAVRLLALSLPFASMASCTTGYATAKRKMVRHAMTGLCEQAIRMGVSLWALVGVTEPKRALLGAAVGVTAGEVFSFFAGVIGVLSDKLPKSTEKGNFREKMKKIALPDGTGSILRSILSTVQNLLIPKGMIKNGADPSESLSAYGRVHGMALPVILYPSGILAVMSGLLIPEVAGSKKIEREYITKRVLHFAFAFSLIAAGAMAGFANELSRAVYGSDEAATWIRLLAPLIPVMYLDMTTDGVLKGLGLQNEIMKINLLDSAVSVMLIYFLVPKMGIYGYVFMVYFTEIMNFALSFALLVKKTGKCPVNFTLTFRAIASCASAVLAAKLLTSSLDTPGATPTAVIKITLCAVITILFLIISGSLSKDDVKWFVRLLV